MTLRAFFHTLTAQAFALRSLRNHDIQEMLSKCSNPGCSAHFRYLHSGRLFRFDARNYAVAGNGANWEAPKKVEFFWLCEACSGKFTLISDGAAGARVVGLHRRAVGAAAAL